MMHQTAVVPDQDIARPPILTPDESLLNGVKPKLVEQSLRFLDIQTDDVRVRTTAQVKRVFSGFGVCDYERMYRSG